jgi:DNA (cytosine-5)-methyltransferase 1
LLVQIALSKFASEINMNKKVQTIKTKRPIVAVDLFCGIGALTCGLRSAGLEVSAGFDIEKSCSFGYEKNNETPFYERDVSTLTGAEILTHFPKNSIKILVGCAPCQPFSAHANKNKGNPEDDKRWSLLDAFGKLVREVRPEIVSMENVPNIQHHDIFNRFIGTLKEEGYHIFYKPVYCPDFGIPQTRTRLIVLASKFGKPSLIDPTHKNRHRTVKESIGGLEVLEAGQTSLVDPLHKSPSMNFNMLARIRQSKPGGTWLDWDESLRLACHRSESGQSYKSVYGRMIWDAPSPTITTQFYNYGTGRFGHPEQDRAISLREGAILQTFPVDYQFVKSGDEIHFTKIGRFIGNAVPVKLGEVIGKSILEHLKTHLPNNFNG